MTSAATELPPTPIVQPKQDSTLKMKACVFLRKKKVNVIEVPRPLITEPGDAIIRVTLSTICGSDLHLYNRQVPEMHRGDILGHEFMGTVESVGPEVKNIKVGDRVVVSFSIICGKCEFCLKEKYTCCEVTNPSDKMKKMYGDKLSGIFGYSHLTGGYPGGQAEFVRVPFADNCCLKIPDHLSDEQVIFLSDVACTGWHANELGKVSEGDVVAVWGCGPVGLAAQMWAKFRGASRVIAIDGIDYRLEAAKKLGCEVIDYRKTDVVKEIRKLVPYGPDVCIEAAGYRFPKRITQKIGRKLGMENDTSDILNEMIMACKKGERISIVGDYFGKTNAFNIGGFMEKSLTMAGGQAFVQKYWKQLLEYISEGKVDLTFLITHRMALEDADIAYDMFDKKKDGCLKILLKPGYLIREQGT